MIKAIELYPEFDYYGEGDYNPIIKAIGEPVVQVDDKDYQGDSRILYHDNRRVGYLIFGWGSCSGCDALQACGSIEEVQELIDELVNKTMWFDSAAAALDYFKNKDWELEWAWNAGETKDFVDKAIAYLEDIVGG